MKKQKNEKINERNIETTQHKYKTLSNNEQENH